MGKDKFENEELIKYGFPEDIWFVLPDPVCHPTSAQSSELLFIFYFF